MEDWEQESEEPIPHREPGEVYFDPDTGNDLINMPEYDLSEEYKEHIAPLAEKLYQLCKKHNIPSSLCFAVKNDGTFVYQLFTSGQKKVINGEEFFGSPETFGRFEDDLGVQMEDDD